MPIYYKQYYNIMLSLLIFMSQNNIVDYKWYNTGVILVTRNTNHPVYCLDNNI